VTGGGNLKTVQGLRRPISPPRAEEGDATMKITRSLLAAAIAGIAVFGASPSNARPVPNHRLAPIARQGGDGFQEASIALNSLALSPGQRDKIHELVSKYDRKIADIRRDHKLAPSKREDKIWKAQTELRDRVMHVLTADQRARVNSIARRQDRGGRLPRRR
jgi:Spy/CpxP family protein refolding chaperone